MNKRILLGIDGNLSLPALHALRVVSEMLQQSTADLRLVLLHVISVSFDPSHAGGTFLGSFRPFPPLMQQRLQAEHALWSARTTLQQQGIVPERIAWLQQAETPGIWK